MTIVEALNRIVDEGSLKREEAKAVMGQIMSGGATPAQIGAFLVALRMKGETEEEVTGFAEAMRAGAVTVPIQRRPLTDTCGTGGDAVKTFNVSTAAAFIAAGAGATVAKHGNRSVTSLSGSADVLEELGYRLDLQPGRVGQCIEEIGIGFLFAPSFHPAMKHALAPRREIGLRTVFNVLGPLTNPLSPESQVLGVYDGNRARTMARVLKNLGVQRAFVVYSLDGMDEISVSAPTQVTEVRDGQIHQWILFPEDLGIKRSDASEVKGSHPKENARLLIGLLSGDVKGAVRDMALLNAAAALIVGGIAGDFREGLERARESIDSRSALEKLNGLIQFSQRQVGS